MGIKWDFYKVKDFLKKEGYSILQDFYKNGSSKIKVSHDECGTIFYPMWSNFKNGTRCPKCYGNLKLTKEDVDEYIKNNAEGYVCTEPPENIDGIEKKITFIHLDCNKEFEMRFHNFKSGQRCPTCMIKKRDYNRRINLSKKNNILDNFPELCEEFDYEKNGDIIPKEVPSGSHLKLWWKCSMCGNEWKAIVKDRTGRGDGCSLCKESKGEKIVRKFLEDNGINFVSQKVFKECKDIGYLKFDFYLPEKNICIEYNGEQHYKRMKLWGDENAFDGIHRRDKIKVNFCKENNIKLLIIKYTDIKKVNKILIEYLDKVK